MQSSLLKLPPGVAETALAGAEEQAPTAPPHLAQQAWRVWLVVLFFALLTSLVLVRRSSHPIT